MIFSTLQLNFTIAIQRVAICVLVLAALSVQGEQHETRADIFIDSPDFSVHVSPTSDVLLLVEKNPALQVKQQIQAIGQYSRIEIQIRNVSHSAVDIRTLSLSVGNSLDVAEDPKAGFGASFYAFLDPFIVNADSGIARVLEAENFISDQSLSARDWFGWDSRYRFSAVRFNDAEFLHTLRNTGPKDEEASLQSADLVLDLVPVSKTLEPGEVAFIRFDYLNAIKERTLLKEKAVGLEGLLFKNLWSWLRWFCFGVWALLDLLHAFCQNWGVSIVLLALVIRIVIMPITKISLRFQERSIAQQARIAPLVADIKKNYSGMEQSEKIVALYEAQNYDQLAPFKGMLGLFIQLPVFVALFNVIGETYGLSGQSFLWISDLARSDRLFDMGYTLPYFGAYLNLLPILMAAITILSTWLAAKTSGNKNLPTTTLFGMGGVFFVLFYSFPAALVLYWMCSNLFQLLQQLIESKNSSAE